MTTIGLGQVPTAIAVTIDEFLATGSGQVLIETLKARTPELEGRTLEETAMRAREQKGWSDCIKEMLAIAKERPEEPNPLLSAPMNMSTLDDSNPSKRPKGEVH